ncbi:uncharacterized protein L203_103765 [Cryptococcus depauperatus CBS 7841]|uniref:Uncharacterized protein n=1 Tax=Cryptococcus depauperatus CBS 7841 TaxID=1295531 RepID=A0A1E3IEE6_9TREE|nr:pod-specific dehydrogenase [Cryptococcus depauperatus CBS 7841]
MGIWTTVTLWIHQQISVVFHSGFPLFFWIRTRWNEAQIPDQTNKVAFITGGNSGIGYAIALALYNAGATVYIACRNQESAQKAADDIVRGGVRDVGRTKYPKHELKARERRGRVEIVYLDLADFKSIDACVVDFVSRESKLDLLFCNAGVMATNEGLYTKQGYTLQFGTNVLGHHRLIEKLLPLLLASPPTCPSRVILSSSAGHFLAPYRGVDLRSVIRDPSDVQAADENPKRGKYEREKWVEYGQSKWGNIAMAKYLYDTYGKEGRLISIAVHPGLVATNLASHLPMAAWLLRYFSISRHLITRSSSIGALNQLYAATLALPDAWFLNGEYIVPWQTIGVPRSDLNNIDNVNRLWEWCDEQQKKYE